MTMHGFMLLDGDTSAIVLSEFVAVVANGGPQLHSITRINLPTN
jgi:hypothetical protein